MVRDVLLGQVSAVVGRGTILVKAPGPLPVRLGGARGRPGTVGIGMRVMDATKAPVGRVTDVIGPVASPTVVVSPAQGARLHRLPGKDVYASEGQPDRRKPPRGRPRRR